jgi:hypothetical protein
MKLYHSCCRYARFDARICRNYRLREARRHRYMDAWGVLIL